jgi:hypothetical protein
VVVKNTAHAEKLAVERGLAIPNHNDFYKAMEELKSDVVSINTCTVPSWMTLI